MRDASAGKLKLTIDRLDGVTVVRAEGEVDLENADDVSNALRGASAGGERVVLDLLGVPFMDSSGLRALLTAREEIGERLSLVLSPGAPVGRLLDLAEVRTRFPIYESLEGAVAAQA